VKSNYNSPLRLDHDGQRIRAAGPLLWDTPNETRIRVISTITQGAAIATGTSGDRNRGDSDWDYQAEVADGGTAFQPGPATAVGVIQVVRPEGGGLLAPWTQVVTLEAHD
jgi:hypothetical protein